MAATTSASSIAAVPRRDDAHLDAALGCSLTREQRGGELGGGHHEVVTGRHLQRTDHRIEAAARRCDEGDRRRLDTEQGRRQAPRLGFDRRQLVSALANHATLAAR